MKILIFILFINFCSINAQIKNKIQNVLNRLPVSTKVSLYVFDASKGESVFEKNISQVMIPASNTKLFTTAASLQLMGLDHKLTTEIYIDDNDVFGGVVNGNLYIKGFGHSTFNLNDLDTLINKIVGLGITQVTGNIIADDTYFDSLYTRDDWIVDERANVKLPPVSALVINKNQFVIRLSSTGKVGSKLKYSLKPECSFIKVKMNAKVTTFRSYPRVRSSFVKNKLKVTVTGGLRKRKRSRSYVVNINNPPLYFALLFKEKLQKKGIKILGEAKAGITPSSVSSLSSVGIQLDSLIALINKNSNNYLAECLFKTLGAFYSDEVGNSFYATQAVLSAFDDELIIDDNTAVVDGSGISRFNTITTGSIGRLLYKMFKNDLLFEALYKSLSISGIDGTLKDRPINNFIRGNFHGKTGTLNGVTALSGYLVTKENHTYIISIIMEYKKKGSRFHKNIEDKILWELSK